MASTIGVLYSGSEELGVRSEELEVSGGGGEVRDYSDPSNLSPLTPHNPPPKDDLSPLTPHNPPLKDDLSPLTAYCYLLFILLYFPCIATIAAIRHETGSWRWAAFAAAYTTALAWLVSAIVRQVGLLLLG